MTQTSLLWTTSGSGDGALAGYAPERIWMLLRAMTLGGDGIAHEDDLAVSANVDRVLSANLTVTASLFVRSVEIGNGYTLEVANGAQVVLDDFVAESGTATVAPGAAMVSGIPYINDADIELTVGAATAQNRIDRVVLRAVWQTQTVRAVLKAGTEGRLTPPALTRQRGGIYEVPLAIVGANVDRVLSANLTVTASLFVRSVEIGNGYTLEVANGAQVVLDDVATITDARTVLSVVAAGGVVTTMLADGAVTTTKVANAAVTNAKLANMVEATVRGRAAGAGTGAPIDLTAAQLVDIVETADGSGSGLDADTLDGTEGSGFSPTVHTHSGYSAIVHTHTGYSPVVHTHNEYAADAHLHPGLYAALVHVHSGYADLSHTHTIYSPASHTHVGYAVVAHNHDGTYSPTVHTHNGYATAAHNHDGVYAPTVHTHSQYAVVAHDHDGTYSPTVHTHTGYATAAHNHDGTYSPTVHTHTGYATAAHNHDGTYSPTSHTHSGYAITAHTHGTSTIVDDAVTNAKLAAIAEETVKGRALGAGTGAPTDLTVAQVAAIVASPIPTRIFAANTTISSSYVVEWIEIGNGAALEVASTGTLVLDNGRTAHLDADLLDGQHGSGFSATVHTHSGYSPVAHTHSGYATPTHTHSGYSAISHTHSGYAAIAHTHSGYSAIVHTHFGYSPASHTHTQYSPVAHTHSTYAATTHSHGTSGITNDAITNAKLANMGQATMRGRAHNAGTGSPVDLTAAQVVTILSTLNGSFSGLDADLLDGQEATAFAVPSHNHDDVYAATTHNHDMPDPAEGYIDLDTIYSRTNHNHGTRYAVPAHNHNDTYAPEAHNHNDTYSADNHNHDGTYSPTSHTHTGYAATSHNHDGTYSPTVHSHGVVTQTYGLAFIGQSVTVYRLNSTKILVANFSVSWSSTFEFNLFWSTQPITTSAWDAADQPATGTAIGAGYLIDGSTYYRLTIKIASNGLYMSIADAFPFTRYRSYTLRFSVAYI